MTLLPPQTPRQMLFAQARNITYFTILCLFVLILWKLAEMHSTDFVAEGGVLENMQLGILLLTSLSFGIQAIFNKIHRPVLLLLASLTAAAVIRELDAFFDDFLPIISWKFCWLLPISAIIYNIRRGKAALDALISFQRSNCFTMLVTAAIIIIPIGQILGHRSFLNDMLEHPGVNTYLLRRIMEEPIELMGYLQILLASIEFYIEAQLRKKH